MLSKSILWNNTIDVIVNNAFSDFYTLINLTADWTDWKGHSRMKCNTHEKLSHRNKDSLNTSRAFLFAMINGRVFHGITIFTTKALCFLSLCIYFVIIYFVKLPELKKYFKDAYMFCNGQFYFTNGSVVL